MIIRRNQTRLHKILVPTKISVRQYCVIHVVNIACIRIPPTCAKHDGCTLALCLRSPVSRTPYSTLRIAHAREIVVGRCRIFPQTYAQASYSTSRKSIVVRRRCAPQKNISNTLTLFCSHACTQKIVVGDCRAIRGNVVVDFAAAENFVEYRRRTLLF